MAVILIYMLYLSFFLCVENLGRAVRKEELGDVAESHVRHE